MLPVTALAARRSWLLRPKFSSGGKRAVNRYTNRRSSRASRQVSRSVKSGACLTVLPTRAFPVSIFAFPFSDYVFNSVTVDDAPRRSAGEDRYVQEFIHTFTSFFDRVTYDINFCCFRFFRRARLHGYARRAGGGALFRLRSLRFFFRYADDIA